MEKELNGINDPRGFRRAPLPQWPLPPPPPPPPARVVADAMVIKIHLAAITAAAFCILIASADAGCPFQNPFWFVDRPKVEAVSGNSGNSTSGFLPRVRLMWGRIENFKCVDYFQVEYFQMKDPVGTARRSSRIGRDRRSFEIEVGIMFEPGNTVT